MVLVDGGSEFRGQFEIMCRMYDIKLSVLPTSAKYKAGLVERRGAALKLMLLRVIHELSITKEQELRIALAMCCQAKNRLLRKCGKSPLHVIQGRDVVVPSSLMQQISDGEVRMSTNHSISHDEELNRIEQLRCSAISAFHWLDSHERLRVAFKEMHQELTGEHRPSGYEDLADEAPVRGPIREQAHEPIGPSEPPIVEPSSTAVPEIVSNAEPQGADPPSQDPIDED